MFHINKLYALALLVACAPTSKAYEVAEPLSRLMTYDCVNCVESFEASYRGLIDGAPEAHFLKVLVGRDGGVFVFGMVRELDTKDVVLQARIFKAGEYTLIETFGSVSEGETRRYEISWDRDELVKLAIDGKLYSYELGFAPDCYGVFKVGMNVEVETIEQNYIENYEFQPCDIKFIEVLVK